MQTSCEKSVAEVGDAGVLVRGLVAEHDRELVRFIARRLRSSCNARDIAQEAYLRLLRFDRKDLIRDPRPYLYRIAANLLYEAQLKLRANASALQRLGAEHAAEVESGYEDKGAELGELQDRLKRVLGALSPKCRAVLILHRRDQLTYDEIAAELGISSSMVKKYLCQGLLYCREHLADLR